MWIRDTLRKEHWSKRLTPELILESERDSNGLQITFCKKAAEDSPTHNAIKGLKSVKKGLQAGCITSATPLSIQRLLLKRAANVFGIWVSQ